MIWNLSRQLGQVGGKKTYGYLPKPMKKLVDEIVDQMARLPTVDACYQTWWELQCQVEDINRFTKDDVVCALEMFNEDYVTFPRDDIAKVSGLSMPVNKRNWRKQKQHVAIMSAIRDIVHPDGEWRNTDGRPTVEKKVFEWRQQHPDGCKADCHRDTGLDPKTIRKWWDMRTY